MMSVWGNPVWLYGGGEEPRLYIVKDGVLQSGWTTGTSNINYFEQASGYWWLRGGANTAGYGYFEPTEAIGQFDYLVLKVSNELTNSSSRIVASKQRSSYAGSSNRTGLTTLGTYSNAGPMTWSVTLNVNGGSTATQVIVLNVSGSSANTYLYITDLYFTDTLPT